MSELDLGRVTVVETMKSRCHSEKRSKSRHCDFIHDYLTIGSQTRAWKSLVTTSRTFSGGASIRIVVSSVALNQDVMVGGPQMHCVVDVVCRCDM